MIYNGSSGLGGVSMPSTLDDSPKPDLGLALRAAAKAWTIGLFVIWSIHILFCYLRLLWLSFPMVRSPGIETMTYKAWVEKTRPTGLLAKWTGFEQVWAEFTHAIMVPLFSAVCTAPEQEVLDHPVEEFLGMDFLQFCYHPL